MIIRADTPEGKAIRAAVKKATGTPIKRVKNTYYIRMWMQNIAEAGKTLTKKIAAVSMRPQADTLRNIISPSPVFIAMGGALRHTQTI